MIVYILQTSHICNSSSCLVHTLFLTAPSAPPDMISVSEVYSDSVDLSWSPPPPEYHNGEITGYNVTVTATTSGVTFTIFSAINSTIIRSLTPFTTYTYSVAAVTRGGIGPYSTAGILVTSEAGKLMIMCSYL